MIDKREDMKRKLNIDQIDKLLFSNNRLIITPFVLIMLTLIILNLPHVSALGITPGRTSVYYQQGLENEVQFSVLNNEHKNMQVLLTVQGDLADSVTLFDNIINFLPSEESKPLKYSYKLPDSIAKSPGLHTAEIVALEVPKSNEKGTYVGATVSVISQLYVYVPCPGKCIESDLNVLDAESNGTATFIVPVINRGKLGIGEARAVIDVYTGTGEKLASVETDYQSIEPGARTELSGKWKVNTGEGNYVGRVSVFYDGETKNFEKQFSVGSQTLSIESILVNDFTLGEIAKLRILVENRWNEELKSVFANLQVYNSENQVMADIKSASEDIPVLSKKELVAYWDTVGVSEGQYDGKLMVIYGKKSSDKNLVLKVSQNSLDIAGVGYAIRGSGGRGVSLTTILLVIVILLLIVNLAWFVFFRRFVGRRGGKGERMETHERVKSEDRKESRKGFVRVK
ncbi:MAG: hypothetical protein KKE50_01855 [Nanoarchaeota archaeon]|nr:hypothetical protein [Nanoarchaeota archaeon]